MRKRASSVNRGVCRRVSEKMRCHNATQGKLGIVVPLSNTETIMVDGSSFFWVETCGP